MKDGNLSPSGSVKWRGAHFISTSATGKLDPDWNVTEKVWEWK